MRTTTSVMLQSARLMAVLCMVVSCVGCSDVDLPTRESEATCRLVVDYLREQLTMYSIEHGRFPESLMELDLTMLPGGVSTNYLSQFSYRVLKDDSDPNRHGYALERTAFANAMRSRGEVFEYDAPAKTEGTTVPDLETRISQEDRATNTTTASGQSADPKPE